jgi:serine/threonine protein kinase
MQITDNFGQTYIIKKRIKAGKFNFVYLAEHNQSGKEFIIKFIDKNQDITRIAQLKNEFLIQVRHPNIVTANDWVETNIGYFLIRPYYHGEVASKHLEKACFSDYEIVKSICDILEGLHELHQNNIIHGDIRPSNILITPQGNAKLIDLGLARAFPQPNNSRYPFALLYASPEQILQKHAIINQTSDLFSVGSTLYHLLLQQPPVEHSNPELLMHLQINMPIKNNYSLSDKLFQIISKACVKPKLSKPPNLYSETCLEKLLNNSIALRYKSAREMLEDLLPELNKLSKTKPRKWMGLF